MDQQSHSEPATENSSVRRQFLKLMGVASVGALAGCTGADDNGAGAVEARESDWCVEENDVEVPESLRTAESIDGIERDLDELNGREEAAYQCHPQGYQLCANCQFFIPGKPADTGSGVGACAIVEGLVRSQDWCALYQPTERLEDFPHPEPLETEGSQKPPN